MGGGFSPSEQRLTEPMSPKRAVGWAPRRGSGLTPMGNEGSRAVKWMDQIWSQYNKRTAYGERSAGSPS